MMGISKDAVRKRIARGTLQATKDDEEWTVFLDAGQDTKTGQDDERHAHLWELIQSQRLEIDRLRGELERKDTLMEKLIERIPPQLPAPEVQSDPVRRPWWKFWA